MGERRGAMSFTPAELRGRLRQYDRTPFLDLLAVWLECAPSAEDIQRMAHKSPDKWVTAMTQIARSGGFTDKTETDINMNVSVSKMSDSQLEDRMRKMAEQLGLPAPSDIYAEFEEVDVPAEASSAPDEGGVTEPSVYDED